MHNELLQPIAETGRLFDDSKTKLWFGLVEKKFLATYLFVVLIAGVGIACADAVTVLSPEMLALQETNYTGYTYGLNRVIEQHNKLIEKFPHTVQTPYQREPDRPFNPSPSLSYEAAKQVTWE